MEAATAASATLARRLTLRARRYGDGADSQPLAVEGQPPIATVASPSTAPPVVHLFGHEAYRIEPYGRGWKLAARTLEGGDVLLWYTGHWIRSGGTLLVAPDRYYDVRSKPFKRLDLHLKDPDGRDLLSVTGHPLSSDEAEIAVDLHDRPSHDADAPLLTSFMATLGLLVYRTGAWQRGYGVDGAP